MAYIGNDKAFVNPWNGLISGTWAKVNESEQWRFIRGKPLIIKTASVQSQMPSYEFSFGDGIKIEGKS